MTAAQAIVQNSIRVMIVDDHKSIVWGLERLVESAHPQMEVVGTATTCAEMLAQVQAADPDVILLDLDLNGEDAAATIPELHRMSRAQVLVLTGSRDQDVHQTAFLKGAHGVIGKDESAEILLQAIERVYAGDIWIKPTLMGRVFDALSAGGTGKAKADPDAERIASLTPRERSIVRAVVQNRGAKSQTIAATVCISEHTLRNHLTVIYDKLGVRNRIDLFAFAIEHGL